jgi:hypothetical protein
MISKLDNNEEHKNKDKQEKFALTKQINIFYGSLRSSMNIQLITNYLEEDYANKIFEGLKKIKYNSDEDSMVKIAGKSYVIPRKQIAFGEPDITYHFSGINVPTYDWNKTDSNINSKVGRELKKISKQVEETVGAKFNYALVNNYLNNTNSIGYHSDDEKELGRYPLIAGLSLGQERMIYFKSKETGQVIKISLPHNSLVIMYYPTNKYWKHSIPKSAQIMGQRISLTFRSLASP